MLVLDQWFQTLVVNCSAVVIYPKSGEVKPATKFWLLQVDVLHGSKLGVGHGPENAAAKPSVFILLYLSLYSIYLFILRFCKVNKIARLKDGHE